ncbi:MAG: hypothetical protein ACLUVC_16550 [Longibaculum sp.]
MAKQFKVKINNRNFAGMSHGLMFKGGVSEAFDNEELYNRLLSKGYEKVDIAAELKAQKEAEEKKKAEIEAEIQKRIDEGIKEALEKNRSPKR